MNKRRICIISTGGTIEKTYDEQTGSLANRRSLVRRMLRRLRLEEVAVNIVELMSKDSLELTDEDRSRIVDAVRTFGGEAGSSLDTDGIVILHGTDTLATTGRCLHERIATPRVPIVLTGAMRPFEMTRSDALQNLTEAIFAAGVLAPGVYCVAHGRALPFPNVEKDRQSHTFVKK